MADSNLALSILQAHLRQMNFSLNVQHLIRSRQEVAVDFGASCETHFLDSFAHRCTRCLLERMVQSDLSLGFVRDLHCSLSA